MSGLRSPRVFDRFSDYCGLLTAVCWHIIWHVRLAHSRDLGAGRGRPATPSKNLFGQVRHGSHVVGRTGTGSPPALHQRPASTSEPCSLATVPAERYRNQVLPRLLRRRSAAASSAKCRYVGCCGTVDPARCAGQTVRQRTRRRRRNTRRLRVRRERDGAFAPTGAASSLSMSQCLHETRRHVWRSGRFFCTYA